jgi:PncC family amidohydrolase
LATAESCTGGLVSMAMCSASSSADYFSSGFVTYTNDAKMRLLKVDQRTLEKYTAVSQATAREMAAGAKAQSGESVSLSVTGYAGPDDGPDGTPAGTIWFGWGLPNGTIKAEIKHFSGDSESVINQAALFTLTRLKELLQENN